MAIELRNTRTHEVGQTYSDHAVALAEWYRLGGRQTGWRMFRAGTQERVDEREIPAPFGLIYGREGANYPEVSEAGPFASAADARVAIDARLVERFGGVMIVDGYDASDGHDICTGAGRVVEVLS